MGLRLDGLPYNETKRSVSKIANDVKELCRIHDKQLIVWLTMYENSTKANLGVFNYEKCRVDVMYSKEIYYKIQSMSIHKYQPETNRSSLSLENTGYVLIGDDIFNEWKIADKSIQKVKDVISCLIDEIGDIFEDNGHSEKYKRSDCLDLIINDYYFNKFCLDDYVTSILKKEEDEKNRKDNIKYRSISEKMFEEHNNTGQLLWSIAYNPYTRQRNLLLGTIKDNKFRYKYRFDPSGEILKEATGDVIEWRCVRGHRSSYGPNDCLAYGLCTYETKDNRLDEYKSTASMFAIMLSRSTDEYKNLNKCVLEESSEDPERAKQEDIEEVAEVKANIPAKQEPFINKSSTKMSKLNNLVRESFMEKNKKELSVVATKTVNTINLLKRERDLLEKHIDGLNKLYNTLEEYTEENNAEMVGETIKRIEEYVVVMQKELSANDEDDDDDDIIHEEFMDDLFTSIFDSLVEAAKNNEAKEETKKDEAKEETKKDKPTKPASKKSTKPKKPASKK